MAKFKYDKLKSRKGTYGRWLHYNVGDPKIDDVLKIKVLEKYTRALRAKRGKGAPKKLTPEMKSAEQDIIEHGLQIKSHVGEEAAIEYCSERFNKCARPLSNKTLAGMLRPSRARAQ